MALLSYKLCAADISGHIHKYNLYSSKTDLSKYAHVFRITLPNGNIGYCGATTTKALGLTGLLNSTTYYAADDLAPITTKIYTDNITLTVYIQCPSLNYTPSHPELVVVPAHWENIWIPSYTDSEGNFIPGHYEQTFIEAYTKEVWIPASYETGTATVSIGGDSVNVYHQNGTKLGTYSLSTTKLSYTITGEDLFLGGLSFTVNYNSQLVGNINITTTINGKIVAGNNSYNYSLGSYSGVL